MGNNKILDSLPCGVLSGDQVQKLFTIAKEEVGNVITQSVVALSITVEMTHVLPHELVREVMLSKVPEKVHAANNKAYDLGVKYAKEALASL